MCFEGRASCLTLLEAALKKYNNIKTSITKLRPVKNSKENKRCRCTAIFFIKAAQKRQIEHTTNDLKKINSILREKSCCSS